MDAFWLWMIYSAEANLILVFLCEPPNIHIHNVLPFNYADFYERISVRPVWRMVMNVTITTAQFRQLFLVNQWWLIIIMISVDLNNVLMRCLRSDTWSNPLNWQLSIAKSIKASIDWCLGVMMIWVRKTRFHWKTLQMPPISN